MINNDKIRIRQAVPEDVDAVTDVLLVSMPQDRDWWDYRFPHRDEHPDEHRRFFRRLVEAWISPEFPDWVLMVAEVCALEDEATGTYRVGAYAAWDISYLNYRTFGPGYKPRDLGSTLASQAGNNDNNNNNNNNGDDTSNNSRRDANLAHVREHSRAADEGHEKFLDVRYGTEQIHLQALGTHPSATRRGLARALCRWGMERAATDGVVATLQAAPLARAVYPVFGFQELGVVKAQVEGEEEKTFLFPMVWDPKKQQESKA